MASKYRNIKTHGFDSKAEYARWLELRILEKAGKITHLRRQEKYPIWVNGVLICKYIADAYYELADGTPVVEDTKGVRTAIYRIKRKLMKAVLDIDIKEVSANEVGRRSLKTVAAQSAGAKDLRIRRK